jgi:hypothetical protein
MYVCMYKCMCVCMFLCTVRNVCVYIYVRMFVICVPVHVNVPYKSAFYSCLSEDEPVGFETCGRRQKLKNCIKLRNVHFVCCITTDSTRNMKHIEFTWRGRTQKADLR